MAADFVKARDFVAAITTCYEPSYKEYFVDSPGSETSLNANARFLAEYGDACLLATQEQRLSPALVKKYLEQVLTVADKYFELFTHDEKPLPERAQTVVSNLIAASINLNRQPELLDTLHSIGSRFPAAFRPGLLNEWEKLLKSDPGFQRKLEDWEIKQRLQTDADYQSYWTDYANFLKVFAGVPQMSGEARRRLSRLQRLTTT